MDQRESALYEAFRAKDARFDGRFFVGIRTTGIYCRPVCRARLAKPQHCAFFATAAAAQQAGYRPCLLCRPELAPGDPLADAGSDLARRAARLIEAHCAEGLSIEALASRLYVTSRHLRRVFTAAYHVSPLQYLQTARLLLAKQLLTETGLKVADIAMAAGFGSLRRMNDLFQTAWRLSPTALRRQAREGRAQPGEVTVALAYRPPYDWEAMLNFLSGRAIPGVEKVEAGAYLRTVSLSDRGGRPCQGWIRVSHRPENHQLALTLSDSLVPVLAQVLARVRRLFDLDCDPAAIGATLSAMDDLRPGLYRPGTRLPGGFEPFETAVRAILGQQVRVATASALAGRLAEALGEPVATSQPGLSRRFPTAEAFPALGEDVFSRLGELGVIRARSACVQALARALVAGELRLDPAADPEKTIERLLSIKGIGPWTAQYIAMRALSWPDAFLPGDAGLLKALPCLSAGEMARLAEAWRPWRSYAVMNLWRSLQEGA